MMRRLLCAAVTLLALTSIAAAEDAALVLQSKIPLGAVRGRIDHLAVDVARRRLLIAELGNDSLGVVDLARGKVLATIGGLAEPQGVGYAVAGDTIYVANARDGSLRLFAGETLVPAGRIDLGDDADNVRVDAARGRVFVGYGGGAIAEIDVKSRARLGDDRLPAHPEGFQLASAGGRLFVNVPEARQIAVLDRATRRQIATWRVPGLRANFPIAVFDGGRALAVVFRQPAKLVVLDAASGAVLATVDACGDADDVFADDKRRRLYVSCGEGFIDVFAAGPSYARLAHLPTSPGARTALFVPELDRLYLAVRGTGREAPAIWAYRPTP